MGNMEEREMERIGGFLLQFASFDILGGQSERGRGIKYGLVSAHLTQVALTSKHWAEKRVRSTIAQAADLRAWDPPDPIFDQSHLHALPVDRLGNWLSD